ncbi:MAG: NAD(P)/FAD-dependent oxidoreductase [Pirellulales bacterium]
MSSLRQHESCGRRPLGPRPSADWDVVVIGAGPSGCVAAHQVAMAGLRTLLIEAREFPRQKVCGGCLNADAVSGLIQSGLGPALASCGAAPLHGIDIHCRGRTLSVPLPAGLAVCRAELDAALMQGAVGAGAEVLTGATATVLPTSDADARTVTVRSRAFGSSVLSARVVLACDGLGRPSLRRLPDFRGKSAAASRLGVGARWQGSLPQRIPLDTITMAVGKSGYVGLARLADGSASVAAAVDRRRLGQCVAAAVAEILEEAGVAELPALDAVRWRGTAPLTQSAPRVAAHRLFVLGDAASYVEPFTGEGMAAAIRSAIQVAPLALQAVVGWREELAAEWARSRRRVQSREKSVRFLAAVLRRPRLTAAVFSVARRCPRVAAAVARRISAPAAPPIASAERLRWAS